LLKAMAHFIHAAVRVQIKTATLSSIVDNKKLIK